jgi:hypothetical protein
VADNARYEAVWSLHRVEALQMTDRVLSADGRHLTWGWDWQAPDMGLLASLDVTSSTAISNAAAAAAAAATAASNLAAAAAQQQSSSNDEQREVALTFG